MTTKKSKQIGFEFIPVSLGVLKIDLKLVLPSSGRHSTSLRQIGLDELMVYSYMQQRKEFFKSLENEYYDSYTDISKATRVPCRTVEKIVPRLKKIGILSYNQRYLSGKTSNVYSYIISPTDFIKKYNGHVIDLTREVAEHKANLDFEAHTNDQLEPQRTKSNTDTPMDEKEPVRSSEIIMFSDISEKRLANKFKKMGLDFSWDAESKSFILSQKDQTMEIFGNIKEAETCYKALDESFDYEQFERERFEREGW